MPQFFFQLLGPRPSFPQDATAEERALMQEHAAYTRGLFDRGLVLAYGPVFDPAVSFGVALMEADTLQEVESLAQADPSVRAGMNTYRIAPMIVAASQPSRSRQGET